MTLPKAPATKAPVTTLIQKLLTPALCLSVGVGVALAYSVLNATGLHETGVGVLYWGFVLGVVAAVFEFIIIVIGIASRGRTCTPEAIVVGLVFAAHLGFFIFLAARQNQPSPVGPIIACFMWAETRCVRRFGLLLRAFPLAPLRQRRARVPETA